MKHFDKNLKWEQKHIDYKGTPRPYLDVPKDLQYRDGVFFLHERVPIPWQSEPKLYKKPDFGFLGVIVDNEKSVYDKGLCAFCGIAIDPNEEVIRWTTYLGIPNNDGPNVFSDNYPFHINCMKQGRIFCPFMRTTQSSEFEYGLYKDLKEKADRIKNTPPN